MILTPQIWARMVALVLLTEGYASPFFAFFMFVLLAAAFRWVWHATALSAGVLVGFMVVPTVWGFYISMTSWGGLSAPRFVGLNNYIDLWTDPQFRDSVAQTASFTFYSVFFKFWLGLAAAVEWMQDLGVDAIWLSPIVNW